MRRLIAVGMATLLILSVSGCATRPAPEVVHQTIVPPTAVPESVLAQTEAVAMPEADFWNYISLLHGTNSKAAYRRLTVALEAEPLDRPVGFARMTLALYALDDKARAIWYSKHDPSGLSFVADDDFLYFRADTVSAGRATWQKNKTAAAFSLSYETGTNVEGWPDGSEGDS